MGIDMILVFIGVDIMALSRTVASIVKKDDPKKSGYILTGIGFVISVVGAIM